MNGLNGKPTEYPENALVPYPVILAASKGDPDAMKIVLQHFSGYIASLSMRKLYDERGNVYFGVSGFVTGYFQIDFGGVGEPFVGACFAKSEVYKMK